METRAAVIVIREVGEITNVDGNVRERTAGSGTARSGTAGRGGGSCVGTAVAAVAAAAWSCWYC